jgi:hypothetical protein
MATFALISEGPTDQIILEAIIAEICEEAFQDGLEVNFLQPLRDATDLHCMNPGGWERVLEYCRTAFNVALESNDFVVVHIDTDAGEEINYGLPLTEGGKDRTQPDLVRGAVEIISKHIGSEICERERHRIIFAITVHSIEAWLLLYLFNVDHPKNSHKRLNRQLVKTNCEPLTKEVRSYQTLARQIKRKRLMAIEKKSGSLLEFIRQLQAITSSCEDHGGSFLPGADN